jgi:hypothetical protein
MDFGVGTRTDARTAREDAAQVRTPLYRQARLGRLCLMHIHSHCAAASDELDDEHHDSDDQQQMDQAAGHMETETEKP